jgi:hypothetical protein
MFGIKTFSVCLLQENKINEDQMIMNRTVLFQSELGRDTTCCCYTDLLFHLPEAEAMSLMH